MGGFRLIFLAGREVPLMRTDAFCRKGLCTVKVQYPRVSGWS